MRLTLALLKRKSPNGNIMIGKNRLAHHIYPGNIEAFVKRLQIEENNMLLLRHPYLSSEQERGDGAHRLEKKAAWLAGKKLENAATKCRPSVRMEKTLGHLLVAESWDP